MAIVVLKSCRSNINTNTLNSTDKCATCYG
jgi:hypothetical protein